MNIHLRFSLGNLRDKINMEKLQFQWLAVNTMYCGKKFKYTDFYEQAKKSLELYKLRSKINWKAVDFNYTPIKYTKFNDLLNYLINFYSKYKK